MLRSRLLPALACLPFAAPAAFAQDVDDRPVPQSEAEVVTEFEESKIKDLTISVPTTWSKEDPATSMRLAQYKIPASEGDKEPALVAVFNFGGPAGSAKANLKRWADQFDAAGRKVKVTQGTFKTEQNKGKYYLAHIQGTFNQPVGPPIRRQTEKKTDFAVAGLIVMLQDGLAENGDYFIKMTGPKKTVAEQLKNVRGLIKAVADKETVYDYETGLE